MPKGVSAEVKRAWHRIRLAWRADRLYRHSAPPLFTKFHVGKRMYRCRQDGDEVQILTYDGRLQHSVKGKLPDKIDLVGLQAALDLLEVGKIMSD